MDWKVVYGGKSLSDFGINIALCKNPYVVPIPSVETTHVNGRSGDLHFYYGDYANVELTYLCMIDRDFDQRMAAFKAWLYQQKGYKRLEDYTNPDIYRMAVPLKETAIGKYRDSFEVTFNCMPQKFLKTGEKSIKMTSSGSLFNPTLYDALPLIRVKGTGNLSINNVTIRITSNSDYTDIDCQLQDAYHEGSNRNSNLTLLSGNFFSLRPGKNNISLASGMSIEITPRWWTL